MLRLITNKKIIAATITFILMLENCTAIAATYYVDPQNGIDSNLGTASRPWKTISRAKEQAEAGDTVYLRPGDYGSISFNSDNSGNAAGYITYKGDPDTITKIRPADWWNKPFDRIGPSKRPVFSSINLSGASYLQLENFDIEHYAPDAEAKNMIGFAEGAHHIQIKNLNLFGYMDDELVAKSTGAGIIFYDGTYHDVTIENCFMSNMGLFVYARYYVQFDRCPSGNSLLIKGNHMYNAHSSGIKLPNGAEEDGHNTGVVNIEGNHIWHQVTKTDTDGKPTHASGIALRRKHVHIKSNSIHGGWSTRSIRTYQNAFDGENGRPDTGYQDIVIVNNLIYDQRWYVELLDVGSNITIANNTIAGKHKSNYNDDIYFYYAMQLDSSPNVKCDLSTINIYNNIFVGKLDARRFSSRCSNNIIYYAANADDLKDNNIVFRPNTRQGHYYGPKIFSVAGNFFVGSDDFTFDINHRLNLNDAFKLVENAPAIGYADPAYAPPTDLLGNPRVGAPDAGCYEYLPDETSAQPTPPGPPTGLVAESVTENEITISWNSGSQGESNIDYYKIYRNDTFIDNSYDTAYTDDNLTQATKYNYKVSAVNKEGLESSFAAGIYVETTAPAPDNDGPAVTEPQENTETPFEDQPHQAVDVKERYKIWFKQNQKFLSDWCKENRWHLVMDEVYRQSIKENPLKADNKIELKQMEHVRKARLKNGYVKWYKAQKKLMVNWMKQKRMALIKSDFQDASILNESLSSLMNPRQTAELVAEFENKTESASAQNSRKEENTNSDNNSTQQANPEIVKAQYRDWFVRNQKIIADWAQKNRWHLVMNDIYEQSLESEPLDAESSEDIKQLEHKRKAELKDDYIKWYKAQKKLMVNWMKAKRSELARTGFTDPTILDENLNSVINQLQTFSAGNTTVAQQSDIVPTEGGYE